jgi:uncharacterized RDD family membrane protein YckC
MSRSSPNPYQAPAAYEPLPPDDCDRPFVVAGRWRRLVGGLVDCIVNASVFFVWQSALTNPRSIAWLLFMGPVYFATTSMPLVLQAALIARSGQSVGKLVTRTRIVLSNGRPAGLLRGFLLRTFPFAIVFCSPWVLVGPGTTETRTLFGIAEGQPPYSGVHVTPACWMRAYCPTSSMASASAVLPTSMSSEDSDTTDHDIMSDVSESSDARRRLRASVRSLLADVRGLRDVVSGLASSIPEESRDLRSKGDARPSQTASVRASEERRSTCRAKGERRSRSRVSRAPHHRRDGGGPRAAGPPRAVHGGGGERAARRGDARRARRAGCALGEVPAGDECAGGGEGAGCLTSRRHRLARPECAPRAWPPHAGSGSAAKDLGTATTAGLTALVPHLRDGTRHIGGARRDDPASSDDARRVGLGQVQARARAQTADAGPDRFG